MSRKRPCFGIFPELLRGAHECEEESGPVCTPEGAEGVSSNSLKTLVVAVGMSDSFPGRRVFVQGSERADGTGSGLRIRL